MSELARSLADHHNCKVAVVSGRRSYITGAILPKSEDWEGISISRLAYRDWNLRGVTKRSACNLIFTAKVALKLLFGPKYDVVLVTTAPPFLPIAASILRFFRRTPYAYMIYDLEPERSCRLGVIDCQKLPAKLLKIAQRAWLRKGC
ncbi:MAG: hypothetical protein H7Y17_04145 [Chlorobia bacterium]|nr:hypothetical protein [Fimbriimonadaceae bacterium]